jgi:hypothetical protein
MRNQVLADAAVRLFKDGDTFAVIGSKLGITRSAVSGIVLRARKKGLLPPSGNIADPRVVRHKQKMPDPVVISDDPAKTEPLGCRFIYGDPGITHWNFCQEPQREGSSYCDHHYRKTTIVGSAINNATIKSDLWPRRAKA